MLATRSARRRSQATSTLGTNSVYVRIRPPFNASVTRSGSQAPAIKWKWDNTCISPMGDDVNDQFEANVFGPEVGTPEIYSTTVKPIVQRMGENRNGIVLCYGQSNSGKTHTVKGILPLAAADLFQVSEEVPNRRIVVSFLAIHNGNVLDVFNEMHEIRLIDTFDSRAECVGLFKRPVNSVDDVNDLLAEGEATLGTKRLHRILQLGVESQGHRVATLSLVDLGGSDSNIGADPTPEELLEQRRESLTIRGRTTSMNVMNDRQRAERERKSIREDLLNLRQVVKMAKHEGYVPFRGRKLTRILSSVWGDSTNMAIICTINPTEVEETRSTLQFANLAKEVPVVQDVCELVDDIRARLAFCEAAEAIVSRYRNFLTLTSQITQRNDEAQSAESRQESLLFCRQMTRSLSRDLFEKLSAMLAIVTDNQLPNGVVPSPLPSQVPLLQEALEMVQRSHSARSVDSVNTSVNELRDELDSEMVVYLTASERMTEFAKLSAEWAKRYEDALSKCSQSGKTEIAEAQKLLQRQQHLCEQQMEASSNHLKTLEEKVEAQNATIARLNEILASVTVECETLENIVVWKDKEIAVLSTQKAALENEKRAVEKYYVSKRMTRCFRAVREFFVPSRDPNYRPWHRYMTRRTQ